MDVGLYSVNGDTFIGDFDASTISTTTKRRISKVSGTNIQNDSGLYVYIKNPAKVQFVLGKSTENQSRLSWVITPLCYGGLLTNSTNNVWMYRKEQVVFSAISEDDFDVKEIISAYKALVR